MCVCVCVCVCVFVCDWVWACVSASNSRFIKTSIPSPSYKNRVCVFVWVCFSRRNMLETKDLPISLVNALSSKRNVCSSRKKPWLVRLRIQIDHCHIRNLMPLSSLQSYNEEDIRILIWTIVQLNLDFSRRPIENKGKTTVARRTKWILHVLLAFAASINTNTRTSLSTTLVPTTLIVSDNSSTAALRYNWFEPIRSFWQFSVHLRSDRSSLLCHLRLIDSIVEVHNFLAPRIQRICERTRWEEIFVLM
jgi:hypothetical protein